MNRLLLSFRVIAILSIFISPVSWSASILHQQQSVSRDFTYLSFHDDGNDNAGPYVRADIVGGEHMSYVYVAGFAGQAYRIEFKSLDGDASAVVHGAGVRIERHADDISAWW
ncbi:hypothetical protein K0504_01065 [Neiella marina]|uniref:Uncharacterized protein n=1 Tax=Neiella holothuriorum TaxID=2870530 RepID=A0ABS7EBA5_9GAMM|nr:hypothetical protein [Neiella holothuriorum]MBW8189610.1 hypothetical protein [Neiella holothuriorum]